MQALFKKFMEKTMSEEERLDFLEELYWIDWIQIEKFINIEEVFSFLKVEEFSLEEISLIIKLYNNPGGDYVKEYSDIIINLYWKDKLKFFKALNLEREEISNLVYLFRNEGVFEDEKREEGEILAKKGLSEEEVETIRSFFLSYEKVCSA